MAVLAEPAVNLDLLQVPSVAPRFQSDSVDAMRTYVAGSDTDHSRQVLGSGPLGWRHVLLPGRSLQLHWVSQRLGQILRGGYTVDSMVHAPLSGSSIYRFGRRRIEASVGQAVFIVPGQHYDVQTPPGTSFALGFSLGILEQKIKPHLCGTNRAWLPRTCRLDLAGEAAARLLDELARIVRILTSAEAVPGVALEGCETNAMSALAQLLTESGGAKRASALSAERAQRVEEWIETHLHEHLTLDRLCRFAGVGGRALQKTFLERRGSTPIQYLTNRRLEAARAKLLEPADSVEVTSVAMACGFTHMGRFSTMYRQRFGESPSATLRRRASP